MLPSHLALVALSAITRSVAAAEQLAYSANSATPSAPVAPAKKTAPNPLSWHHGFGWSIYILVGLIVLFGVAGRCLAFISYRRAVRKAKSNVDLPPVVQPGAGRRGILTTIRTLYRRHISSPAVFGGRHMQPFGADWFSVPSRLQAIMISIYIALNIIFMCVGYRVEGLSARPKSLQLGKQIGDRAGILSVYNMPLLWALAGRNDILIWLTGWSFRSMNIFHRWVARMAVVQAIVHSAAYTWLNRENIALKFDRLVWRSGTFATVFFCLMLVFSARPIRKRWYEVFLVMHILLSVLILILLFFHLKVMDGTYNTWLWFCLGIWAFDRTVRFLRIAVLSFRTVTPGPGGRNAVATIADPTTGLIRLAVDTSLPITPCAGAYYFLYTPWSSTPWQSHPFSLASWEPSANGKGTTLHFLIAPRGGATRRLRNRIERAAETEGSAKNGISLRVLMEGPYGIRHPVHQYEHIQLVAGGSGITAMLPCVYELQRLGHQNVSLAWIVRDASYANDVLARELSPENRGNAKVTVFASAGGALVRVDSNRTLRGVGGIKDAKFNNAAAMESQSTLEGSDGEKDAGSDDSHDTMVDSRSSSPSPFEKKHMYEPAFPSRCATPLESHEMERGNSNNTLVAFPMGSRSASPLISPVAMERSSSLKRAFPFPPSHLVSPLVTPVAMERSSSLKREFPFPTSHLVSPLVSPTVTGAERGNPFDTCGTPLASPDLPVKKNTMDFKGGDLLAHLVMKKKFLSAETRSLSFQSTASSSSTVVDYDETDELGGSNRTAIDKCDEMSKPIPHPHRVIHGRPAMRLLISQALDQLVGNQRLAVMSCGPYGMMDDLRAAVTACYGSGPGQVPAHQLTYFEDAFEW